MIIVIIVIVVILTRQAVILAMNKTNHDSNSWCAVQPNTQLLWIWLLFFVRSCYGYVFECTTTQQTTTNNNKQPQTAQHTTSTHE